MVLRASVITLLAKGDGGLDEGQRLADHEDQRTTRKHYHLDYDDYDTHPAHILSARLTAA